ncbi:hypothetical protein WJS89_03505 [Sphingomicrobium sp. XHP0235]|uniref:hypothetical protein n=1 Tax=Sphingomicrobium aquimarinum TaxID=3133971 RepID=UPI0031FF40DC
MMVMNAAGAIAYIKNRLEAQFTREGDRLLFVNDRLGPPIAVTAADRKDYVEESFRKVMATVLIYALLGGFPLIPVTAVLKLFITPEYVGWISVGLFCAGLFTLLQIRFDRLRDEAYRGWSYGDAHTDRLGPLGEAGRARFTLDE